MANFTLLLLLEESSGRTTTNTHSPRCKSMAMSVYPSWTVPLMVVLLPLTGFQHSNEPCALSETVPLNDCPVRGHIIYQSALADLRCRYRTSLPIKSGRMPKSFMRASVTDLPVITRPRPVSPCHIACTALPNRCCSLLLLLRVAGLSGASPTRTPPFFTNLPMRSRVSGRSLIASDGSHSTS